MDKRTRFKGSPVWMTGDYKSDDLTLKRAIVRENVSGLTETTIEFKSMNKAVELKDILGRPMSVVIETPSESERRFSGLCVSVENLGFHDGFGQYVAQVRPWLWLLTRARNSRIFQELTAVQIIEKVFSDHGFADFETRLFETYETRNYCVQYRETDFDFVCRLMEEEGIYYFFDNGTSEEPLEKLVLCDGLSSHQKMPEQDQLQFFARHQSNNRRSDFVGEWSAEENITPGKITLNDFDFLSPTADLKTVNAIKSGNHAYTSLEQYDYPGHYRKDTNLGSKLARTRMEAEAIQFKRWRGACSVRNLSNGYTFSLLDHPDVKSSDEFLVIGATHYLQHSASFDDSDRRRDVKGKGVEFPEEMEGETYACVFSAIPKQEQYRAPLNTPWPEISGLHTATVVGQAGEEIWTDEYGRIKVQFHWDRDGNRNDKSSCWVRVVTPWSGKGWGMVAIPRVGQEVVIQFEEGDPDRPICTGMLYNNDTKPPYALPDNATQSGIKTNSSKGGGGFNELMLEDKKGEELVRFQAEKDYQQIVKNNATITVGEEKQDPGNLSLTVFNDETETVRQNKVQVVGATYNQTIGDGVEGASILGASAKLLSALGTANKIKSGDVSGLIMGGLKSAINEATGNTFNQTVNGKHTHAVTTNFKQMVGVWHDHLVLGKYDQKIGLKHSYQVGEDLSEKIGNNHKHTVKKDHTQEIDGKHTKTVEKDVTSTVTSGDMKVDVKQGKITVTAMQKIELKVGKSSITIDNSGIKIKGPMVTVQGDGSVTVKSPSTTVKGDAMLTLKGGMTLIN